MAITGSDMIDAWQRQPDDLEMEPDTPSPHAFVGKPYTQTAIDRRLERAASMRAILADIARTPLEVTAKVGISNGRRKHWRSK